MKPCFTGRRWWLTLKLMNTIEMRHNEALGKTVCAALEKRGFTAVYTADSAAAAGLILDQIKPGMKVAHGGSMTLAALGVFGRIAERGATFIEQNEAGIAADEKARRIHEGFSADIYLSGTNALTRAGDLVNVDGVGNRVAALAYGPKKIIVVVGINKIVRDIDAAFERIETVAAPLNSTRLEKATPCVKTGHCMDCDSESRICRIYEVIRRRPMGADFEVIVVGEALGY